MRVLNAIPIFYLSYLKIPVHAWKKIRRLQREFLWGGRRGRKKISWIKWETVCLPKKRGGLGVRDIRVVNISLLTKWRWRLLDNNQAVWKDVLISKYGADVVGRVELGENCKPWYASLWWRDVCSMGSNLDINWFSQNVLKKVGNGALTSFWKDKWIGDAPLKNLFPRLFAISNQKEASVADIWNSGEEHERWNLQWRRRFFVWEENLLEDLLLVINAAQISDRGDSWSWQPTNDALFTVKSAYHIVSNLSASPNLISQGHAKVFQSLWKIPAPSKVSGFAWQLLHDKIPTKVNLVKRNIIATGDESLCPLCGQEIETAAHLFIYCRFAFRVWWDIFFWLNVPFCLPHDLFSIFNSLLCAGDPRARKGRLMIGCAVVWMLWKSRNLVLFENSRGSSTELVEGIKVVSWKWWLARKKNAHCLYYEWREEPGLCFLS
jgi:hypothetical protein